MKISSENQYTKVEISIIGKNERLAIISTAILIIVGMFYNYKTKELECKTLIQKEIISIFKPK